jgi:uncharacterized membrane protein (DUF4010 family)
MLPETPTTFLGPAVALGIGLLIGVERERRKGSGPARAFAGVRSFTVVALTGAFCALADGKALVLVGAMLVAALAGIAYWRDRSRDPGITTELALFITYLLGVTAVSQPILAAGGGAVVALLLAARNTLHRFSRELLSAQELRDALLLAGAILVVLPLLPDQGPAFAPALNPHHIWRLVVLVLCIQAVGHIALRIFGVRGGLVLSGFFSGFVSSTATIAAMGSWSKQHPSALTSSVAGALLSNLATLIQFALLAAAIQPALLPPLAWPLLASSAVILAATAFAWNRGGASPELPMQRRGVFQLAHAFGFAALMTAVTALVSWMSDAGAMAVSLTLAVAGFADAHAAAIASFSLAEQAASAAPDVALMMLLGFSTNTVSKLVAAWVTGGRGFVLRLLPALSAMIAAGWITWWAGS